MTIAAMFIALLQVNPSGEWRTLHTAHFRVHFRPAFRAVALDAAAEAERAYALLATELRPPRGTIDLTLADDVDAPNGFATTYPSNRFTVYLVPPVMDPGLRAHDSWRRLVIVHELAHLFHLDRSKRLWGFLQSLFGRAPGLFPNQFQPSWVVEGIATYYESRFTGGGRAAGSFHRQIVAADAAHAAARSPWDALLFTRWPGGLAPYAYGGRFWAPLADSIVPRFVEHSAGQLIPFRVGRPLRHAGAPSALAAAWPETVAAAAPPDTAAPSALVVGRLRAPPVPRVSPDGRRVAYLHADGRGAPRLRIADWRDGWRTLRSHRVNGQVSYDWLGDTLRVAQLEFTDRWHVRSDLWHWLPDGRWRRATRGARVLEPRGTATVVVTSGDNHLAIGGAAGPRDSAGVTWGAAVPSPDGRWIAATRHHDGHWALVRWPVAAPESMAVLAQPAGGVSDPAWMGDTLLYVADVGGFPQVHAWSATSCGVPLTVEPLGARAPAPLPDGRLLFTTIGRGGWELRVVTPTRTVAAAAAAAAPAAFDSAPAIQLRESGYAEFGSLRPHFWIPLAVDSKAAGVFWGALTAGVDAVGRDAYLIAGLVADTRRAQGGFGYVTHRLGNPTLDVSAANDWSHIGSSLGRDLLINEVDAALGATFVAQRWRRVASVRIAAEYEGERFATSPDTLPPAVCAGCVPRDLVGGSVVVALGHVTAGPLAISAQDGAGLTLLYRRREEQGTRRWSNEARGRLALYARFGPRIGFAYPVLTARIAAGAINGSLSDALSVGGVSSGVLSLPFGTSLGGGTRAFPVRGYDGGALRGRRAATVTLEYRLPLALIGRSIGHLPLGIDKLSLAVFADAGDAWNAGDRPRLHRARAVGVELVGDLTVSYDLPLRVRVGVAQPAGVGPRQARLYGGFAADF
ncbi:MAG: hypothetical protein Q8Q14_11415 [Gemmatimonadales bacterium]|nr:hypothetical protein [Gemmatimonadales bacterium]